MISIDQSEASFHLVRAREVTGSWRGTEVRTDIVYRSLRVRSPFSSPVSTQSEEERRPGKQKKILLRTEF